jgi:hypothetical protein
MEKPVRGPQAPAAGAVEVEERPEEAGRVESRRRRIEKEQDRNPRQGEAKDAGSPATPARTV